MHCWLSLIGIGKMHGSMKPYRGSAAAARSDVKAERRPGG
jgi:hypothetical protein